MWRDLFSFTYGHLRKRGVSKSDAEDIAQEALTSAYVNLDGIDPARLRAWLVVAARNKMVDRYRRENRLVRLEETPQVVDPGPDPADEVIRSLDSEELQCAIEQLRPHDARLLRLRYFEERSLAEIADAIGTSAPAAKVAMFRARQRLRIVLQNEEEAS